MNEKDIADRLKALPPELRPPPDRYQRVRTRIRRRQQARVSLAVVVVLLVALPAVALLARSGSPDETVTVATDPKSPASDPPSGVRPDGVLPGGTRVDQLGEPRTVRRTGTATVDLGPAPEGATEEFVEVECLSPGMIKLPGGGSVGCDESDVGGGPSGNLAELTPDQSTQFVIRADEGMVWELTKTYRRAVVTPWGVNANDQTYGVTKSRNYHELADETSYPVPVKGDRPDLIAAIATNGNGGYVNAADVQPTPNRSFADIPPLADQLLSTPVFDTDGQTEVGVFAIGPDPLKARETDRRGVLIGLENVAILWTKCPSLVELFDRPDFQTFLAKEYPGQAPKITEGFTAEGSCPDAVEFEEQARRFAKRVAKEDRP